MFGKKKKASKDKLEGFLDDEMIRSAETLKGLDPNSAEYKEAIGNIASMHNVKDDSKTINANTVLTVLGSIGSVALIIGFEKLGGGIFTSKAASFIMKPRV